MRLGVRGCSRLGVVEGRIQGGSKEAILVLEELREETSSCNRTNYQWKILEVGKEKKEED